MTQTRSQFTNFYLAQAYGTCLYGEGQYEQNTTSSTQGCAPAVESEANPILANTGTALIFAATIAATLIFITLIIRVWRRPKRDTKNS